jgi:hypothetical protein
MEKKIAVSKETKEFLQKVFGCTDRMVRKALNHEEGSASDLCKRIRSVALQRDGVTMVSLPEVETIHTSDGFMIQTFPSGVRLEAETRGAGIVRVMKSGETLWSWKNPNINELDAIQRLAMSL